jgi:hypothetical protein
MNISAVISFIAILISIAAVVISRQRLKHMQHVSLIQNLFHLTNFLYEADASKARRVVRLELPKIEYEEWSSSQHEAASKVCSSYEYAGTIIRAKLVVEDSFLRSWAVHITESFNILTPFLEDKQTPKYTGFDYWMDFIWLAERAMRHESKERPNISLHSDRKGDTTLE